MAEFSAGYVAQEDGLAGVGDDGEAAISVGVENDAERRDRVSRGGEDDEVLDAGDDLRGGQVRDGHLLAVVDEGILVEVNPRLVDAAAGKGVAHPLGDHDGHHDGQHVRERAGELEHDGRRWRQSCG